MIKNTRPLKGKIVLLIVTAASKIRYTNQIANEIKKLGAKVFILSSPHSKHALINLKLDKSPFTIIETDKQFEIKDKNLDLIHDFDAIVVAPATFNTVCKIALGIADNYVLTKIATAISLKKPIIIAPSYDNTWYHPLNQKYLDIISSWGIHVIYPDLELDHITMAPVQKIIDSLQARFSKVKFNLIHLNKTPELDYKLRQLRQKNILNFQDIGINANKDCDNSGVNGCLSIRDGDWILITSTGSKLHELDLEDLVLVNITKSNDDKIIYWYGDKTPSSETPLCLSLYYQFSNIQAVVHTHCRMITYNHDYLNLKTKTYIPYGEFENSDDLIELISKNNFGIIRLHGEIAIGSNIKEAYLRIKSYIPNQNELKYAK